MVRIQPQRKRINPIVTDPIGNGLQDKASDALAAHRASPLAATRVLPNGAQLGTNLGGAPAIR